jgi:3-phosphoshikimate 1-carboxyvinyltransferase
MADGWKRKWAPSGKNSKLSLIPVLEVQPFRTKKEMKWTLPISKSHALRYLILAAQSEDVVRFSKMENVGEDIIAMKDCLIQLGVKIEEKEGDWEVHGVGPHGFSPSKTVLNARNSGVTLRCLLALCSRIEGISMLDGDSSLRNRPHDKILQTLEQLGIVISVGEREEALPVLFNGIQHDRATISIDGSTSSQPITAWICSSPGFSSGLEIKLSGDLVSTRHSQLSIDIAKNHGAEIRMHGQDIEIPPWVPNFSNHTSRISIPSDASMFSFALLAAKVLKTNIHVGNIPEDSESIGHELLYDKSTSFGLKIDGPLISHLDESHDAEFDLIDANDLITPLSALLALSNGGHISSIHHAQHKESNRIKSTIALLNQFGLRANMTDDGCLSIPGGQSLVTPKKLVRTHLDHRIQMTAMILALGCNGSVFLEGSELHRVADPDAVNRLKESGAEIKQILFNPNKHQP